MAVPMTLPNVPAEAPAGAAAAKCVDATPPALMLADTSMPGNPVTPSPSPSSCLAPTRVWEDTTSLQANKGDDTTSRNNDEGVLQSKDTSKSLYSSWTAVFQKRRSSKVEECYCRKYNDSIYATIAKDKRFEFFTIFVILLNAVVIGWDADYSARWGKPTSLYDTQGKAALIAFVILENFFAVCFTVELIIVFLAFEEKLHCLCDRWFLFDAFLVIVMLFETWIIPFLGSSGPLAQLSVLRCLRLLRIIRMAKLVRAFPELLRIAKGIQVATSAVMWTGILMVIITYMWAILFTSEYHQGLLTDDEVDEDSIMVLFGSMGKSMLTLLAMGTMLDDVTVATDSIRATGNMWMLSAFLLYIVISSFTMLNMFVGVLCNMVCETAESETSNMKKQIVQSSMITIFLEIDEDGSGKITRDEFLRMKENPRVMDALRELDICEKDFSKYVNLVFQVDGDDDDDMDTAIDFRGLLDVIWRLRPEAHITALDLASFKQYMIQGQSSLMRRLANIERLCVHIQGNCPGLGDNPTDIEKELSVDECKPLHAGSDSEQRWPALINTNMLTELEQTYSTNIIDELRRRLESSKNSEFSGPLSMSYDDLQCIMKTAEEFQAMGEPEPDPEWCTETLTC